MANIKIKYLLSETGRKTSILNGGNGTVIQEAEIAFEEKFKKYVRVDESGSVWLPIGFCVRDYSDFNKINSPCSTETKPVITDLKGYSLSSALGGAYIVREVYDESKVYFDKPMCGAELIQWEIERLERIKKAEKDFSKQKEALKEEALLKEQAYAEAEAARIKSNKEKEVAIARDNEIKREALKAQADKEEKEIEKWVEEFGSEHLRKALSLGYDCKKLFVTEKIARELPGFDFNFDSVTWNTKASPSKEAVDIVSDLIDKGFDATIGWGREIDDFNDDSEGEIIVVYLHDYELYRTI